MYWKILASTAAHILGFLVTSRLWMRWQADPHHHNQPPLYIGGPPVANYHHHHEDPASDDFQMPASRPPPSRHGAWLGWGADVYNNRWAASDAQVDAGSAGGLTLTCRKPYAPGVSAPPLVEDGVAYYPTWSGLLVALDYRRCRELWRTNITRIIGEFAPLEPIQAVLATVSRTTPAGDGRVLFVGTLAHALVLAIDRAGGRLVDALQLDDHPFAVVTQSPTYYGGRLLVGVSSLEEIASESAPGYECCTFIGSMNALELRRGRLRRAWTRPMMPAGLGFSGASVWGSQPAVDPVRGQVLVATGNTYQLPDAFEACQRQAANISVVAAGLGRDPCLPPEALQDSVVALDLATGRVNWARQLPGTVDAWNIACNPELVPLPPNPAACPEVPGPDADFGIAPTFVPGSEFTPHGLDVVLAAQKNGDLHALSAAAGVVLWTTRSSPGGLEGGLIWGVASDDRAVYYTGVNGDRVNFTLAAGPDRGKVVSNSVFGAIRIRDGAFLWQTAAPRNTTSLVQPTVANDVVLAGLTGNFTAGSVAPTGPGSFLALDKRSGRVLAEYPLDAYFQSGIAAVHEYVLFGSGYGGLTAPQAGSFQVWKLGKGTGSAGVGGAGAGARSVADEL